MSLKTIYSKRREVCKEKDKDLSIQFKKVVPLHPNLENCQFQFRPFYF